MWRAGWLWFKTKRSDEPVRADDRADMGVEIGLDASLDSRLPPLLDFALNGSSRPPLTAAPLGTDQRSYHPPEG